METVISNVDAYHVALASTSATDSAKKAPLAVMGTGADP
jgi:hypothetical protein